MLWAGGSISTRGRRTSRTFSAHHHIRGTTNELMVSFDGKASKPRTWLEHEYSDNAVFSPDGRYVALVSSQTGPPEIYVRPYPGPGGQRGDVASAALRCSGSAIECRGWTAA